MTHIVHEPDWESILTEAGEAYFKLVLIIGAIGSGKSAALKTVSESYSVGHLNFGEEFSRRLLRKPVRLRGAEAEEVAVDLVGEVAGTRLAIDNTEVLFEAPVRLNPLALLKKLSRHRVIIATWTGSHDDSSLTYGIKDHPAHREHRFTNDDTFIIVPTRNVS